MNKTQLADAVAESLSISKKDAAEVTESVLATIIAAVANGTKVSIIGFGTFERVNRPARTARNPSTGETVDVPESATVKFKASLKFKETINEQA